MGDPDAVVDLVALREACAPVVRWYERFLSEGTAELEELDDALAVLRRLPRLGGRLGRAVTTLASGGSGASYKVLDAFRQVQQAGRNRPIVGLHVSMTRSSATVGQPYEPAPTRRALPGFD